MLSRMKQQVLEKTGSTHKTEYGADFLQQIQWADLTVKQTEKLMDRTSTYLISMGTEGSTLNKAEAVGETCQAYAERLPQKESRDYVKALQQTYEAERQLGALQRQFQKQVEEKVLAEWREWVVHDAAELKKERETLDKKRLAMDAAQNKAKKHDTSTNQEKVQDTKVAHNEQLRKVQSLLATLTTAHKDHAKLLRTFLELQREHFTKAASSITTALEKIPK